MAFWGRPSVKNHGEKNIREALEDRLAELRENSSEYSAKQIYVLDTVDDFIEGQLESRLKEESKLHKGERISIIPYNLGNSHWAGLLLEFEVGERIKRAEYIDPINGSNIIPIKLKNQFVEIYDKNILQIRNVKKQAGIQPSYELLIEYLLVAIKNNRNEQDTGSLARLSELRKIRNIKSKSLKISDLTLLSEAIYRTEQKMKEYEKNGNSEKMSRKVAKLTELKELLDLSREISILENSLDVDELELDKMGSRLQNGLEKFKISDMTKIREKIDEAKQRIEDYQKRKKHEKAAEAKAELNELIALVQLHERINADTDLMQHREKRLEHECEILCEDLPRMPDSAEKSVVELVRYFQQRFMKDFNASAVKYSIDDSLKKLHNQLQRQKMLSKQIRANLKDLHAYIPRQDYVSILRTLKNILKEIRPLNVREVQRLVSKTEKAAEVIRDKDVTVLIGTSRSGKSRTIQFIMNNGAKEIETFESSPVNLASTRCIEPITVSLRNVCPASVDEYMILCDVPAFDSSVDVEVDMTNGLGTIQALKGCSSVKIVALSTLESSYDKSSGIQKIINILTSILDGIEDHLDSVYYAFMKYSSTQEINSILLTMQASKVTYNFPKSDVPIVRLLDDMIEKIKHGADIVDSSRNEAKHLIENLKGLHGIRDPGESFRFTMCEETRTAIVNQVEIYKVGILSAMQCQDIDLTLYYLNDLSILKNLLKEHFIHEAYETATHGIKESIFQDYSERMKDLKNILLNENTVKDQDIQNLVTFIDYSRATEKLSEHLGQDVLSPTAIMQSIGSEIRKRSDELVTEDLRSAKVRFFLDNLCQFKHSLKSFESYYHLICKNFSERFDKLVKSAQESIGRNEFENVAAALLIISETSTILKHHLGKQMEEKYEKTVRFLIEHLGSFIDKAGIILIKFRLNNDDAKKLYEYIEILRSAKENSKLQDRLSIYFEILRTATDVPDLNEMYSQFIEKLVTYFDDIHRRIQEVFKENDDQPLETMESMIVAMEMIRKIPEIEAKTAASYYRIVGMIREYTQQLEKSTRKLIDTADNESGDGHHRMLEKLISSLEKVKWIDRISPGTYENLMRHINDHIVQYAHQLENRLKKLDTSLKCPENIQIAQQFLERIEYLCILKGSVPKLEECRQRVFKYFIGSVLSTFDQIQNTFSLQDSVLYQLKKELNELEETKREYESSYLSSPCTDLSNHNFEPLKPGQSKTELVNKNSLRETSYSLDHLELMKKRYGSSVKLDFLQKKGLHSYDSLCDSIQSKRANILRAIQK